MGRQKNNQVTLVTLREKCRLQVFENRVLREIFIHSRNEVRRIKLHNGELHDCTHQILLGRSNQGG